MTLNLSTAEPSPIRQGSSRSLLREREWIKSRPPASLKSLPSLSSRGLKVMFPLNSSALQEDLCLYMQFHQFLYSAGSSLCLPTLSLPSLPYPTLPSTHTSTHTLKTVKDLRNMPSHSTPTCWYLVGPTTPPPQLNPAATAPAPILSMLGSGPSIPLNIRKSFLTSTRLISYPVKDPALTVPTSSASPLSL